MPENTQENTTQSINLDIFDCLGIHRADTGFDNIADAPSGITRFLEIKFRTADILNTKNASFNNYDIVLPYDSGQTISDSAMAHITNKWAQSRSNVVTNLFGNVVQDLATKTSGDTSRGDTKFGDISNFIKNNSLFTYDAGSTNKTLQIPFIVPLGLATYEQLKGGAAVKMRKIFNDLQGIIYPYNGLNFIPPLMQLTLGGMYRGMYGFITNVQIKPADVDMFKDPYTGEYFHLIYNGQITFTNIFIYYRTNKDKNDDKFNIDNPDKAVLFGDDSLDQVSNNLINDNLFFFGSGKTREAIQNVLYSDIGSRISLQNNETVFSALRAYRVHYSISVPSVFRDDKDIVRYTTYLQNAQLSSKTVENLNTQLIAIQNKYNNAILENPSNETAIHNTYLKETKHVLSLVYEDLTK